MNISHCRFQLALPYLQNCLDHLQDNLSTDENLSRQQLIDVCQDIVAKSSTLYCFDCEEYALKIVVGDRKDLSYGEMIECTNPDCPSRKVEIEE